MLRIFAVTISLFILFIATAGSAVEKLYFADVGNDEILRCDLDGSNLELLVATDIEAVGSIAIDRTAGKMYWTDWPSATAHIKRANLDGTGVETLLSGLGGPWGIALDVPNGKMYWTEFSIDTIRRANLDGSNIEDLVTTGLTHLAGIALDLGGGLMYYADGATQYTAKIERANLDGSGITTLITDPLIAPESIALDLNAGKMYFTEIGLDSLYRANLDGSGLEAIIPSEYGTCPSLVLDLDAGKIYFSDYGGPDAEVKQANLDGSGVTVILSSEVQAVYGLALGPAVAECSDASLASVWLAIASGIEVYDYAVWMIFDGLGTVVDMGAFKVPDPAGWYAVAPDCSVSGQLWTDGYQPFAGEILTDSTAVFEMQGLGVPISVLKVMNLRALEGCWMGHFIQDSTSVVYNVTLEIDAYGIITASTGFPAPPVHGRIYTQDGYLAGLITMGGPGPGDQIMFQDASSVGDSIMSGTYDMDCSYDCKGGTFYLRRCPATGVRDGTPLSAPVLHPNYPNPFNPRTTIAYTLPEAGRVRIQVYDAVGRLVKHVIETTEDAGYRTVTWDGRDNRGVRVSTGVYIVRLEYEGMVRTAKIVLLK